MTAVRAYLPAAPPPAAPVPLNVLHAPYNCSLPGVQSLSPRRTTVSRPALDRSSGDGGRFIWLAVTPVSCVRPLGFNSARVSI